MKNGANFEKKAGGAPANVAASVVKLGGEAVFLGQVGDDSLLDSKGRKLCIFLIVMIAICILVGVLLVIFL